MKRLFSLLVSMGLFLVLAETGLAQSTADIKGRIVDEQQAPIADINVRLQGTQKGAATDKNGYYQIADIPEGSYTLVASAVGFEVQKKSVIVRAGQASTVDFIMSPSHEQLSELVVQSEKTNRFAVQGSDYVAKVPISRINNPQVYNTINDALLEDQVVTRFETALKNAPGLHKLWESTGRGDDGAGYYSLRGFPVQPTMQNGLPALTNGSPDPANIARIEVIKGPSGALYGSSLVSYGGLINVVTKKPYQTFGGNISYKAGSFGLNRVTADINTPINKKDEIVLRTNGAYHTSNSFQDAGYQKSVFVAPSLSYRVNDRLSFLVNTEYFRSESTNPTMLFLNRYAELQYKNLEQLNYDYNNSYTSNDLSISNPVFNLQARMKYRLSDIWTSKTAISRSSSSSDGYYTYLWDLADGKGTFARYLSNQNSTTLGTDIQQNFTGEFETDGIKHQMVFGLDFFEKELINNSSGYVLLDSVSLQNNQQTVISRAVADAALQGTSVNKSTTRRRTYSAYLSDVVHFTPTLSAMASLRLDHFVNEGDINTHSDNYGQTALSPKLGLVYQPIDEQLSLFANYMNGFSNVAPRTQDDGSTKLFEPEQANQWETGMKADLFDGRLTATLSYYDIQVSNVVREDPERANFYIQDGENYSRGIEISITAVPVRGMNIIAGYSHNKSEVTKTSDPTYLGLRPESAGPKDLANAWISYKTPGGPLEGVGFGFGGNYAGEHLVLNRKGTGSFALPAYTVFNASLFYNTNQFRLDLKLNNLTDKKYYNGWSTVNPQKPRNLTASLTYKF